MKVVAAERPRPGILGVRKDPNCSIMKTTGIEFRGEIAPNDEMRACFLKLSKMVPDVPRNEDGNIDGAVLLQYVIDYILDLKLQLDSNGNFSQALSYSSSLQSKFAESREPREPLSEKSLENIVCSQLIANPCSGSDVLLSQRSELDVRPPSK